MRLADGPGTWLYVSSREGEVVQSVTRWQRFWNWLGAIPHWIYPTILREHAAAWRQVVLWVSGPCIAVALTGIWIGILRARLGKRRYRDGRISPYRGWMLWHHLAGLTGGLFLITWIFSGWLSVDPGRIFAAQALPHGAQQGYETPAQHPSLDLAALALRARGHGVRIVQITFASGYPVAALYKGNGDRQLYHLPDLAPANPPHRQIVEAASPASLAMRVSPRQRCCSNPTPTGTNRTARRSCPFCGFASTIPAGHRSISTLEPGRSKNG